MNKRSIPNTDLRVSLICLGTMTFGTPVAEPEAVKLTHWAIDNGVNFIDTEGADSLKKVAKVGKDMGIDLHIARLKPQVLEVLQRDGVIDLIGAEHIHDDIAAAVELHLSKHPLDAPDAKDEPGP